MRPFRLEDVDDVFGYASDPVVTRLAGWQPHRSPFDTLAYIQRCCGDEWGPITFAVAHRAEGRVIGVVDIRILSRLRRIGEIGYTLARPYWGRGLNVEAGGLLLGYGFERLRLRRIRAMCALNNKRSVRTMEKLGMQHHRTLAEPSDGGGPPAFRLVYEIWKSDWMSRRLVGEAAAAIARPDVDASPC